jgi:hypothetical protein
MAISIQRGAGSAALGLLGAGAVMIWPTQWLIGVALIVSGAIVLLSGITVGDRYWWQRRPKRTLYIEALEMPLPETLPEGGPHRIFMIFTNDAGKAHQGWKNCTAGPVEWGEKKPPRSLRLTITNSGPDTLVNTVLKLRYSTQEVNRPQPGQTQSGKTLEEGALELRLERIRAGDVAPLVTYIVSEARHFVSLGIEGAMGAPIGGKVQALQTQTESFPGMMFMWPSKRYENDETAAAE